jgi:type I restriction enzyme R subunit
MQSAAHLGGADRDELEHDKVLARIVTGMVKDDAELFKQFMDNDDFKRWMTARVFELACEQAGAP